MSDRPKNDPRDSPHRLDRHGVRRAFDRASETYDAVATLQAEVRAELLDRLQYFALAPRVALDLGSGTGHGARELKRRYPRALVIATDVSARMLVQAKTQSRLFRRFERVCADAYRLPLATASVDLLFSSLMLQWCDDLPAALREMRRVMRPGGLVMLSSFGPDTLRELREAWAAADDRPHVNLFADVHVLGDALGRAGFGEPVLDIERRVLEYDDALALMRELKNLGAHNVMAGRAAGLTGRRALAAMQSAYERLRRGGKLPATYEVLYATAWAPERPLTSAAIEGEVRIPIGSIRVR
jgi:malonyl-CoA O-methyltransferase